MASGIKVHDSSMEVFEAVKSRSEFKYVFFKIDFATPGDKHKSVIPDYKEPPHGTGTYEEDEAIWNEMKTQLTGLMEPRYVLYDFKHQPETGSVVNRVTFISWSPDTGCSVKNKMLYASSKDYVQKAFSGLNKYHQCNDSDGLDFENILNASGRKV